MLNYEHVKDETLKVKNNRVKLNIIKLNEEYQMKVDNELKSKIEKRLKEFNDMVQGLNEREIGLINKIAVHGCNNMNNRVFDALINKVIVSVNNSYTGTYYNAYHFKSLYKYYKSLKSNENIELSASDNDLVTKLDKIIKNTKYKRNFLYNIGKKFNEVNMYVE